VREEEGEGVTCIHEIFMDTTNFYPKVAWRDFFLPPTPFRGPDAISFTVTRFEKILPVLHFRTVRYSL